VNKTAQELSRPKNIISTLIHN